MAEEKNLVQEFEKGRAQLMNVSAQKQQLTFQSQSLELTLTELEKSKEKKVLKAVGSILISVDKDEAQKEIKKQKDSADLKLKTIAKQEEVLVNKLNKLKTEIEGKTKKEK
ncbi:MAG: prefoldin subunit [Candidatus Diapherotrites archaeon]|nr:prefoldin subunit [Candidatus Diapherotrites archaeon]